MDVPCPNMTGENFRFNLLKNHKVIYHHEDNAGNGTTAYSGAGVEFLKAKTGNESISFRLKRVDARSHGAYRCEGTKLYPPPMLPPVYAVGKLLLVEGLFLTSLVYLCMFVQQSENYFLFPGHQCNVKRDREDRGDKESRDFSWIWIVVLVSVTLYGVIVTICASSFWVRKIQYTPLRLIQSSKSSWVKFLQWKHVFTTKTKLSDVSQIKLKKTDSQSDYINTKPRAPRRPRKNRGVQNPAPRFL